MLKEAIRARPSRITIDYKFIKSPTKSIKILTRQHSSITIHTLQITRYLVIVWSRTRTLSRCLWLTRRELQATLQTTTIKINPSSAPQLPQAPPMPTTSRRKLQMEGALAEPMSTWVMRSGQGLGQGLGLVREGGGSRGWRAGSRVLTSILISMRRVMKRCRSWRGLGLGWRIRLGSLPGSSYC